MNSPPLTPSSIHTNTSSSLHRASPIQQQKLSYKSSSLRQQTSVLPSHASPCATARPLSLSCGEWHNALSQHKRAPLYMVNSLHFIAMPTTASCSCQLNLTPCGFVATT
eukprot:9593421-Ditylum_brightwellii.AAC.1